MDQILPKFDSFPPRVDSFGHFIWYPLSLTSFPPFLASVVIECPLPNHTIPPLSTKLFLFHFQSKAKLSGSIYPHRGPHGVHIIEYLFEIFSRKANLHMIMI